MDKEQIKTSALRDSLKTIMQSEIENLPKTLNKMEAKDRLNVVCRLMPYVFPKVETVNSQDGEPFSGW